MFKSTANPMCKFLLPQPANEFAVAPSALQWATKRFVATARYQKCCDETF
jgi:hypothetical protein